MGDDSQQKDSASDFLDDDLAGDWESAFQADDFSFSPEGGDDDFFLGDETDFTSATSSPYDFTPPSAKELENLPDLDESALEAEETQTPATSTDQSGEPEKESPVDGETIPGFTLPPYLASLYHTIRLRLQLLSRSQQIMAGAAVIILLLLPLLIPGGDHHEQPENTISAPDSSMTTAAVDIPAAEDKTPPPADTKPIPEKVRVKWAFPNFLIPTPPRSDAPNKTNFLKTDITLILLIDETDKIPADKELLVREIIFQFYRNQPVSELRRYVLARGDMNRALRAWLQKQWPDAPIETIVFNRYQII